MAFTAGTVLTAAALNAELGDTGEVALTLGANWTAYYRVVGKTVEFYATYATSVAGGATVTAATGIPSQYLPTRDIPISAMGITFVSISALITSAGSVSIFNTSASAKNPVTCRSMWFMP